MSNTTEVQEPHTDEGQKQQTEPEKPEEGREQPSDQQKPASGKEDNKEKSPEEKSKRRRALLIFGAVVLVAAVSGFLYWLHARNFEDTDDAQIDGNLSPTGTRIDGTIIRVYVQNNQPVKVGDPLVDWTPVTIRYRSIGRKRR